jgi:TRAP-type C4-dicarboxylate transport system substrate-binding protein
LSIGCDVAVTRRANEAGNAQDEFGNGIRCFSELFTTLETKTVDGQENPINTIQSSKFYEVQKYLSITKHVYSPWIVIASKKWWDGLNADEKKALQESAVAARNFERTDSRAAAIKAIEY